MLMAVKPDNQQNVNDAARSVLRHVERERRTLPARLQRAIDRSRVLSAVPAASVGTDVAHSRESHNPLTSPCHPFDLEGYLIPVRNAIEELERAVDHEQGLGVEKNYALMISEEKDREILTKWAGVHSRVVAQQAPALGGQRTIERVRRTAGLRPVDGTKMADREQAA